MSIKSQTGIKSNNRNPNQTASIENTSKAEHHLVDSALPDVASTVAANLYAIRCESRVPISHTHSGILAQGMAVADALAAFAQVSSGHFSHDDKCFFPENAVLGPVADRIRLLHGSERRVVCGSEGESDVTIFFVDGAIAALVDGNRLRSRWLDDVRRDAGSLESLPDFIALPRDEGRARSGEARWRRSETEHHHLVDSALPDVAKFAMLR
jgi:hypothetical protein